MAQTIGKGIIDISTFDTRLFSLYHSHFAALIGAIVWNLITWFWGLPSSSSHALVGGMVGAVLVAYGPDKILWKGLLYVISVINHFTCFGFNLWHTFLKATLPPFSKCYTKEKYFFNRMQIFSSIALSLSHGANDAQKSMGLITMSLVILGFSPTFHIPFWVIASCAAAIALGTASGGWRIIKTLGSKIYRLRSVHAFCAQTASAIVILGAALLGGPVSTTHVVSSSIMGVGRPEDLGCSLGGCQEYFCGLVYHHPGIGGDGRVSFFLIRMIHPSFLKEKGEKNGIGYFQKKKPFSGESRFFDILFRQSSKSVEGLEALWNFAENGTKENANAVRNIEREADELEEYLLKNLIRHSLPL